MLFWIPSWSRYSVLIPPSMQSFSANKRRRCFWSCRRRTIPSILLFLWSYSSSTGKSLWWQTRTEGNWTIVWFSSGMRSERFRRLKVQRWCSQRPDPEGWVSYPWSSPLPSLIRIMGKRVQKSLSITVRIPSSEGSLRTRSQRKCCQRAWATKPSCPVPSAGERMIRASPFRWSKDHSWQRMNWSHCQKETLSYQRPGLTLCGQNWNCS